MMKDSRITYDMQDFSPRLLYLLNEYHDYCFEFTTHAGDPDREYSFAGFHQWLASTLQLNKEE